MFILLTIKDVIRIEPSQFGEEHVQVGAESGITLTLSRR